MTQKILFVDGSNFYHSLKDSGINPSNLDYKKFFEKIMHVENPVVRFYTAILKREEDPFEYAKQQRFLDRLRKGNPNLVLVPGHMQTIGQLQPKNRDFVAKSVGICATCITKLGTFLTALKLNKKHREKGVDVNIAVDIIRLADENGYDTAILISGDADLVPAVKYARGKNPEKNIVNGYFIVSSSNELKEACSSRFMITEKTADGCLIYKT